MGRTENFGFSTITQGGSLDEDGYKYTNEDRQSIDRLLRQAIEHDHSGTSGLVDDPESPPTLDLETSGGALPAGLRLYYRFSLLDASGNETAASPTSYVDTPTPVKDPSAPTFTVATTGGTLLPGAYYYILTAYTTVNTLETMASKSNYTLLSSAVSTQVITLNLPSLPSGATGFNIYRKGPGNPRYYYLASTTDPTYVDDGSTSPTTSRTLPNTNTTNSANKVVITYPGSTPAIPDGCTWKIYRTYNQANWSNSTLHHVVEETSVGSGVIVTEYEDIGEPTSVGAPRDISMFGFTPSKISLSDASEVEGSLPPGLLTVPHQINFGQSGTVLEGEGLIPWVCEFDEAEVVDVRVTLGRNSTAANDITFDVIKYTALSDSWDTVFAPEERPVILQGDWRMADSVVPTSQTRLVKGDCLTVDVDTANEDIATPTAVGWIATILLMVRSGSETTSWDWS